MVSLVHSTKLSKQDGLRLERVSLSAASCRNAAGSPVNSKAFGRNSIDVYDLCANEYLLGRAAAEIEQINDFEVRRQGRNERIERV